MSDQNNWLRNKMRFGWLMLVIGLIIGIAGAIIELAYPGLPFDARIITGVGILLIGIGLGNLLRYRIAGKNAEIIHRLNVEERDERNILIRARAGNRAYWVSTVMIYTGLMWASFAANGKLPALSEDLLWYFLAVCVVVPFIVYGASILTGERKY